MLIQTLKRNFPVVSHPIERNNMIKRFFWLGVVFSLLLPMLVTAQSADDRRFGSRDEVNQAIAAQDRAIANARARMSEAAQGEKAAEAEYKLAKEQMELAVAAELRRTPMLIGSEHKLYPQEMPAEVANELASLRQRLAEMRRVLEVIHRDDELKKAAGLATDNRTRPLLEYSIPLFQGKIAELTTLTGSLTRTHAARERLHESLRNFRKKVSIKKRAEDTVRIGELERYRLLHVMGTKFEPRYLQSVRVTATSQQNAYRATVTEPAEIEKIDRNIENDFYLLQDSESTLQELRRAFLDAEDRFIATSRVWQQTHDRYRQNIHDAYTRRIQMEIVDSAIAVRNFTPASVLFELAWRVGEYNTTDSYRIEEPRVETSLANYRDDLVRRMEEARLADGPAELLTDDQWLAKRAEMARRLEYPPELITDEEWQVGLNREALAVNRSLVFLPSVESLSKHIKGEQTLEFVKGATEIAVVDGLIKQTALAGVDADLKRSMFNKFLHGFEAEPEWLRLCRGGDVAGPMVAEVKNSWFKDKGQDFLISLAVTAGKEAVTADQQRKMFLAAQNVALMDIEYLLRRQEYVSRGAIYRFYGRKLTELEAEIGMFIEQRSQTAGSRTFAVEFNNAIPTTDAIRLNLQFSGPIDGVSVLAAGKIFGAGTNAQGSAVIDIPANTFTAGPTLLSIIAAANRLGREAFDADATTIARYDPAANAVGGMPRFRDLEPGGDNRHRLTFVDPNSGPSKSVVFSRFDSESSAWTVVGDAQGKSVQPTYRPTGGNPGGYIEATDDAAGGVWYWSAPASFYTGLSRAWQTRGQLIMSLTFDLRQSNLSSPFKTSDVVMRGGGFTLAYYSPSVPGTSWTSFKVPLTAAGWRNEIAKRAATESEMAAVMGTLYSLWIRGEYRTGDDIGGLDNVGWWFAVKEKPPGAPSERNSFLLPSGMVSFFPSLQNQIKKNLPMNCVPISPR